MHRASVSNSIAWGLLLATILALLQLVASPVSARPTPACPKGLKASTVGELILGRNIGDIVGAVDEQQWQGFLDEIVTPRFPEGFTVLDASGQWWNRASGQIEREPSRVLVVVLTRQSEQWPRLGEIAAAYKRRFSQQSVVVMLRHACVTF